jgi:hypothetical protein
MTIRMPMVTDRAVNSGTAAFAGTNGGYTSPDFNSR